MPSYRTITAAGLAALALAGGTALTGSSAHAEGDRGAQARPATIPTPARALVSSCDGGAALSMRSRNMDSQSVASGATVDLDGSQWSIKGPRTGTDTILVTVGALTSTATGELVTMAFYKDGVGIAGGSKYFTVGTATGSVQFCTKIGKGLHTLGLKVVDNGGSASYLYYPTVTYQRFS